MTGVGIEPTTCGLKGRKLAPLSAVTVAVTAIRQPEQVVHGITPFRRPSRKQCLVTPLPSDLVREGRGRVEPGAAPILPRLGRFGRLRRRVGRKYRVRFEFKPAKVRIKEVREFRLSESGDAQLRLPPPDQADAIWEPLAGRPIEQRIARLELRAIPGPDQPRPRALRIYLLPDREVGYGVVGRRY